MSLNIFKNSIFLTEIFGNFWEFLSQKFQKKNRDFRNCL